MEFCIIRLNYREIMPIILESNVFNIGNNAFYDLSVFDRLEIEGKSSD